MKKGENKMDEGLLIEFINGEISDEGRASVEAWLAMSPANKTLFAELEKTWIISGKITPKPVVVDTLGAWEKVKIKLTETRPEKKTGRVLKLGPWFKIAAAAVVLVGVLVIYRWLNQSPEQVVLTAKSEILIDTLQDGSIISLNKNSRLSFPENFDAAERRVRLDGEAFFEIEPDKLRPFVVDLDHQAQVTVLGTSFNITQADSTTEVFVKTGKVSFKSQKNAVILDPGEKGILNHETGIIVKAQVDEVDFNEIYWLDQKLNFENTPLREVVKILSGIFDIPVVLENPETGDCLLMTSFERESLEQILQIIAASFGLELVEDENAYILKGNGC